MRIVRVYNIQATGRGEIQMGLWARAPSARHHWNRRSGDTRTLERDCFWPRTSLGDIMSLGAGRRRKGRNSGSRASCAGHVSPDRGRGQATEVRPQQLWEPAPRGWAARRRGQSPQCRRRWTVSAGFLLPKDQGQLPQP